MAQKRKRTIGEKLQENEEIIRELLAEGKSEQEAQKLLVQRALERYFQKQVVDEVLGEDSDKDESDSPDAE
ncbi:MAG TPA: hypothetical protein VKK79_10635 [Candidatus Lokiarchaeia archaeon]|nr:hypothetical protein [Candidatus Lokiarchaeia archaeon]